MTTITIMMMATLAATERKTQNARDWNAEFRTLLLHEAKTQKRSQNSFLKRKRNKIERDFSNAISAFSKRTVG